MNDTAMRASPTDQTEDVRTRLAKKNELFSASDA